jgi:UDP-4-amino-4,6-dideoxy-N-acetyl-beta-L-altrosamine transaminase
MSKVNIPYNKQSISLGDINSVKKVLKSDFLTSGPLVKKFEQQISKKVNSKFAVSTNSATSALHISCLALGLKKGDLVWTSSISFVASANCAVYCGANIDLLDINKKTFNIDIIKLKEKLLDSKKKKRLPKIIIPVHLAGNPCEMRELSKLSKVYNFKIIEDASHALGSLYKNTKIGSCIYSDLTIFSFHPVKMITTAEGGMVTTRKKDLYNKLKVYREHGLIRDIKKFKFSNKVSTYYEQQELGYNYRMSDLNAALGISQLKRLSSFLKKRNQIKNFYTKELKNFPVKFQEIDKKNFCSFHLIVILVSKKIRNKLFKHFRSNRIFVNIHYIPIFFHPFHRKKKYFKNLNSIDYYESAISLPVYFDLKKRQMKDVVKVIKNFFKFNI